MSYIKTIESYGKVAVYSKEVEDNVAVSDNFTFKISPANTLDRMTKKDRTRYLDKQFERGLY